MQSDRSVEPTVEPSITTQAAIQTKGSESTAPLLEGAASDASIAGNVVLPRNSPKPLAISALESEALESEALESNSLLSTDTSKPLVQDGIETVTQPLIQPKIEASAAPAIASLPVIPEVTSADLVQHDAPKRRRFQQQSRIRPFQHHPSRTAEWQWNQFSVSQWSWLKLHH
jgi:hypothetical protein